MRRGDKTARLLRNPRCEIDSLVGIFSSNEDDFQGIEITWVEIHPASARRRIAEFIYERLGVELHGDQVSRAAQRLQ